MEEIAKAEQYLQHKTAKVTQIHRNKTSLSRKRFRKRLEKAQAKQSRARYLLKQKLFGESLLRAKKALTCTFWLACGTALGFYRERGFIEHDRDIDIAMMARFYSPNLRTAMEEEGFQFVHQFGTPDDGLEMTFKLPGDQYPRLDIFFMYEEPDCYWRCFYTCENWNAYNGGDESFKPQPWRTKFSKFQPIKVDFLGTTFNVPPISYIEELYGPNWRLKDENYQSKNAVLPQDFEGSPSFSLDHSWQDNISIKISETETETETETGVEKCIGSIRLFYPNIQIIRKESKRTPHKKYIVVVTADTQFTARTDLLKAYSALETLDEDSIELPVASEREREGEGEREGEREGEGKGESEGRGRCVMSRIRM